MKKSAYLLFVAIISIVIFSVTSCRETKSDKEKIEDGIEEVGEEIEEGAEEIEDEIDDATDDQ